MNNPSDLSNPAWLRLLPSALRSRLNDRPALLAIIHNSSWLLFDRLVRLLLGLFVGVWVARYLGPAQFGELAYVLAYISLFQAIASLGLDGIVVRDIAQAKSPAAEILGTSFALRLFFGVVCWLTAVGGMALMNGVGDRSVILTALAGGGLVFQAADTVDLWFQSQSQSRRTVVTKLLAYLFSNGLRIVLVLSNAPLALFVLMVSVEVGLSAVGLYFSYKFFPCRARWVLALNQARRLLSESWFFAVAGLINMIQARIEFFVIESNLGAEPLGQYVAALRVIEIFDMIGLTIALSVFPKLASQQPSRYDWAIRKTYLVMGGVYLFTLPIMLIAHWAIIKLYGPQYEVAQTIFLFMAFRPLLAYLGLVRGMSIRIDGKAWYSALCALVGALFAYGFASFLVPLYGLYGAIASAALSYLISNVVLDLVFYRKNLENIILCGK